MVELEDINGVGASRAEDLREMGYESVEDVSKANPEDLTALSRVAEDKAIEMVVDAENILEDEEDDDEDTEDDDGTITLDEELYTEEMVEEERPSEEVAEVVEEEPAEERLFELSLDLDSLEHEVLIAALIEAYTNLRSRNVSRSDACHSVLVKLRDSFTLSLTEDELNAMHAAMRQRRLSYQGNNHVDMMTTARGIEDRISALREEELF